MHKLSLRMTNKYVGTYQHMDEWQDIGDLKILGRMDVEPDPDDKYIGEYGTFYLVVKVTSDASEENIKKALRDTFTSEGCSCQRDCCGCKSQRIYGVVRLESTENAWVLEGSWSINV